MPKLSLEILKYSYLVVVLVLCLVFGILLILEANTPCSYSTDNNITLDKISLDSNGLFKTVNERTLASLIYSYKAIYEYDATATDDFVSFFALIKPKTLPVADALTDIALYKLIKSNNFSISAAYIPIFNHPLYFKCINAYDKNKKKFRSIRNGTATVDIIIKEILNIGDDNIADNTEAINSYLSKLNPSYNPSTALRFEAILLDAEEEELYNLLDRGFIANNITSWENTPSLPSA